MSPKYLRLTFIAAVFMFQFSYKGRNLHVNTCEYPALTVVSLFFSETFFILDANSSFLLDSPERWKESNVKNYVQLSSFLWFIQSRDCGGR